MTYTFGVERYADIWDEIYPLFEMHYEEMAKRQKDAGRTVAPLNPNKDAYIAFNDDGRLVLFTVRIDGELVGYSGVYVMPSMHSGELIAREDAIFVRPDHRNGIGKKLTKKILASLGAAGVKSATMTAAADPRAALMWQRMGFKPTAMQMTYDFEGPKHVQQRT